jgi:hypothetical protein
MILLCTPCMNRVHQGGIARTRSSGGCLIGLPHVAHIGLWRCEIGDLLPGSGGLEVRPQPRSGVQRRTGGGPPHVPHLRGPSTPWGGVRTPIVQAEAVHAVGTGLCDGIHEGLEGVGLQSGECQNAAFPRGRRHGPTDRGGLKEGRHWPPRVHATGGQAPTADGPSASTTFVLTEPPDGAGVGRRDATLEPRVTAPLQGRHGVRVFGCDGAVGP